MKRALVETELRERASATPEQALTRPGVHSKASRREANFEVGDQSEFVARCLALLQVKRALVAPVWTGVDANVIRHSPEQALTLAISGRANW